MTSAERVLAHFDRVSESPAAVSRLRRFIFALAVRGKLVEQDPTEEPAELLLQRRTMSRTSVEELWPLPAGWAWSSLRLLGDSYGGGTPSKANSHYWSGVIPWVSPKDMKVDFIVDSEDHINETAVQESTVRLVPPGSLLMVVRGMILAHSFPTALTVVPVTLNQDMKALVPFRADIAPMLLLLTKGMQSEFLALVKRSTHGTCRLLTEDVFGMPLPIPPLAEQHRIVAKVDELMALCDRLEAAQKEREHRRDRLVSASVARLNQPAEGLSFDEQARFYFEHLPRMIVDRAHIQQVRRTILTLGVRGSLVPQAHGDQPVSNWIAAVRGSKHINRSHASTSLFSLPTGWAWYRLGDVFEVAGGIQKTPQREPRSNAYPYLGVSNVYRSRLDLANVKRFELLPGELERRRLEPGDILVIEGNGSFNEIGRCAKWNGEIDNCVHQNHVIRCRPFDKEISDFVLLFLNSPDGIEIMQRLAITSSGLYSLSVGKIRQIQIPLPPRSEHSRIVAQVGMLMALCDRLESQIEAGRRTQVALVETTLRDALTDGKATEMVATGIA